MIAAAAVHCCRSPWHLKKIAPNVASDEDGTEHWEIEKDKLEKDERLVLVLRRS